MRYEMGLSFGWLKTIGKALLGASTNPATGPLIKVGTSILTAFVPGAGTVVSELTQLAGVAIQIETGIEAVNAAKGGTALLTGADKLTAATPMAIQVIKASQIMTGKKIRDEVAFTKAVQAIMSGTADLLNSLESTTDTSTFVTTP
jgi:hypothetical protein